MGDRIDAVKRITTDHERVEQLFVKYEGASDNHERTRIAHEVVHELAVHGEVEELLFYPKLRRTLPDGDQLADEAIDEHLEIKRTLNDLDSMTADDDGFDERMGTLIGEVRHHVEEEESELLPRIREALSKDELLELGDAIAAAKSLVPTRPHPSAPTGPLAKAAASPPVALVDRVRDAIRSRTEKR